MHTLNKRLFIIHYYIASNVVVIGNLDMNEYSSIFKYYFLVAFIVSYLFFIPNGKITTVGANTKHGYLFTNFVLNKKHSNAIFHTAILIKLKTSTIPKVNF